VQRSAISAGGNFGVDLFRLGKRKIGSERDHAMQLGIVAPEPLEVDAGKSIRAELAGLDPS